MVARKLSFRSKLLGITALPLALIGYLSVNDVQDALSTRQAAARQLSELDRQAAVSDLADAIGNERSALFDPDATDEGLAGARAAVDEAIQRLRSPDLALGAEPLQEAERVYGQVVDLRARIGDSAETVRTTIATRDDPARLDAVDQLSRLPQQLLSISGYDISDRGTLANLTTAVLVERARESLALEGVALQQALAEGAPSQVTLETVGTRIGSSDEALNVALDLGVPSTGQQITAYLNSPAWAEYQSLRARFTRLLIGQHVRLDPAAVLSQRAAIAAELESHETDLRSTMQRDTVAIDNRASRDLLLAIVISLGVLALLAGFLFLLARSIRTSLGRVEHRATNIATVELPSIVAMMRTQGDLAEVPTIEEIPVETGDEIGRLSAAFNELHRTAVRLASEQAMSRAVVAHMFVNLGRRNQKLLMRMLESLDELERHESDPDRLAKIYNIDHLATRMRRNAESLLILADVDVARRFTGPVLVSELLRSTMSEVEEFDRIRLNVMDDAEIVGDAAADLGHLLSELTENAARFSPPTEPIEIIARYTRVGYILAVVDSGLGLTDDEIAEANARIAAATTSAETPSKNLGLFVVGKLAGKYGMEVEIFDRVPAGLTVRVRIPRDLIVSPMPEGVLDSGPRPIAPPVEPRSERVADETPVAAAAGVGPAPSVWSGATPSSSISRDRSNIPPSLPSRPLPPTAPHDGRPLPGMASAPTTASAPAPAPAGPAAANDLLPLFGTGRRVAGANLPEAIDRERPPGGPDDSDAFRRSAESVRADLGALQRGLAGTPAPSSSVHPGSGE
ncbi:MAG: nitrate- and nitrite sensing domain-containing protein [Acidimicrobiales bacterium]